MSANTIGIDNKNIDLNGFFKMFTANKLELTGNSMDSILKNRAVIEDIGKSDIPTYGITTGFGELINRIMPSEMSAQLQLNLVRSHATGIGDELHPYIVRAIMLARVINFVKGYSGISLPVVDTFIGYLNDGIYPIVHEQGSLGASGDLSPLSEIALGIIGEGEGYSLPNFDELNSTFVRDLVGDRPAIETFDESTFGYLEQIKSVNFDPVKLGYKEGLSLLNGTSAMTGIALIAIKLSKVVYELSQQTTAMTLAALRASTMPFDHKGVAAKKHTHMQRVAAELRTLLDGCNLVRQQSHIIERIDKEREGTTGVIKTEEFLQNAYSLRVIPQVMGAFLSTLEFVEKTVLTELNGANDNPLVIENGDDHYIYHGAHFHGQYVAFAMDYLNIALTQLAQLSDRRTARLIDANYNDGLTDLLAPKQEGFTCGFEGLQYSSTSVVAEMKSNATPSSIQSIPSNLNNQDLVSMGMLSARKTLKQAKDALTVVAVELRIALQAVEMRIKQVENNLDMHDPVPPTKWVLEKNLGTNLTNIFYKYQQDYLLEDRHLRPELQNIKRIALEGAF